MCDETEAGSVRCNAGVRRWPGTLLALAGLALAGCGGETPGSGTSDGAASAAAPAGQSSAVETASPAMESHGDTVYVDVRSPSEYAAGHVEGAINIPHTEMDARWRELEQYRDDTLVLYCRSGRRSGIAQGILQEHGFDRVTNAGGLRDLQRQGAPVTP